MNNIVSINSCLQMNNDSIEGSVYFDNTNNVYIMVKKKWLPIMIFDTNNLRVENLRKERKEKLNKLNGFVR